MLGAQHVNWNTRFGGDLPPNESGDRRRPVLVIGPPRSGTTWVEEVLGSTGDACTIHEPDNETINPFALRAKSRLGRFPVLGADDEAPPDFLELWERAFAGLVHGGSARWLAAKMLLKTASGDLGPAFDRQGRRMSPRLRLARGLAAPPSVRHGRAHVIVKSVHGPLAVEWIVRHCRPQVVVLRRNPFSIVASHVDLGWHDACLDRDPAVRRRLIARAWGPPLEPGASRLSRLAWQIGLFTAALDEAASRNPDWHVVSHEELCRDPEGGFRALCADLGLTWSDSASAFLAGSNRPGQGLTTRRVAAEQPDRWRRRLSPEQLDEVAEVLSRFPASAWTDGATA
jgi:hypothetical protein